MYGEAAHQRPEVPSQIVVPGSTLSNKQSTLPPYGQHAVSQGLNSALKIDSYFSQNSVTDSPVTPQTPYTVTPDTSDIVSTRNTVNTPPQRPLPKLSSTHSSYISLRSQKRNEQFMSSLSPRARCNRTVSPRSAQSLARSYKSRRNNPNRVSRSSSAYSSTSNSSYESDGSSQSSGRKRIECVCGRQMEYTKNPMGKYPPKAVLYCQQNGKCKRKMVVEKDYFYCCRSRTSVHGTKDGKFKICYACSISATAKQERVRMNHQLLVKQLKSKQSGKVLITNDTKEYILSSTSANTRDETIRLLRKLYIEPQKHKAADNSDQIHTSVTVADKTQRVIKEGFMMKRGNFWNKSLKERYFKLLDNRTLIYYGSCVDGVASDERGTADLKIVNGLVKKKNSGLRILTPAREWKCQCANDQERDEWYEAIARLCKIDKNEL